jgi:hypothetical protein
VASGFCFDESFCLLVQKATNVTRCDRFNRSIKSILSNISPNTCIKQWGSPALPIRRISDPSLVWLIVLWTIFLSVLLPWLAAFVSMSLFAS